MSKEQLQQWNCVMLAEHCKQHNIIHYKGKTRYRKAEMIDAILKQQSLSAPAEQLEKKIEDTSVVAKEKEATGEKNKEKYLQNIKIGTLVAFRESSGKLNTAAVQNVSFKRERLRLVTQYGKEFIISFNDVVWVRTKKRWPRFVFEELKQRSVSDGST